MASPTVLLNTLVKEEQEYFIDTISKVFLIGEVAIGLNRLPVLGKVKPIFVILAYVYKIVLAAVVFYITFFFNYSAYIYDVPIGINVMEYLACIFIGSLICKRLSLFYKELDKFDKAVGCRPKTTATSIKNIVQMTIEIFILLMGFPYTYISENTLFPEQLPVRLIHVVEVHFYGHLLSLLVPRIRLVNFYMKSSSDTKEIVAPKVDEFVYFKNNNCSTQNCEMKKLMELYSIIINAYDLLIDAIKWQLLLIITLIFMTSLTFAYTMSLAVIRGSRPLGKVVIECGLTATQLVPLFAPCVFGDQIHDEVRRLRELLASRLYENKLDKPSRSIARALLALTEARNLSFSLLQIFDIDISLPFKFMGLLLTYLIILLQFEKVINP